MTGAFSMTAFHDKSIDVEVKEKWGDTEAYAEFSKKTLGLSSERFREINAGLDAVMGEFSECMMNGERSDSPIAQAIVAKLQSYITENYYTCTNEILLGLGKMYTEDERFRRNIDSHAEGTAAFICSAIGFYCA